MTSLTPEEIRAIGERARQSARGPHIHRPVRIRDEDVNVIGAFCTCGALFNEKIRPAQSASLRKKIVARMEQIKEEAEDE